MRDSNDLTNLTNEKRVPLLAVIYGIGFGIGNIEDEKLKFRNLENNGIMAKSDRGYSLVYRNGSFHFFKDEEMRTTLVPKRQDLIAKELYSSGFWSSNRENENKTIDMGVMVKDKITGFTGIVTAKFKYLNGSDKYFVEAITEENTSIVSETFEQGRLIEVGMTKSF